MKFFTLLVIFLLSFTLGHVSIDDSRFQPVDVSNPTITSSSQGPCGPCITNGNCYQSTPSIPRGQAFGDITTFANSHTNPCTATFRLGSSRTGPFNTNLDTNNECSFNTNNRAVNVGTIPSNTPFGINILQFESTDGSTTWFTCANINVIGCGDGDIQAGETCDQGNGNVANGDGCSSTCQTESGFTCTGTPSTCTLDPVCGNGMIESGEDCDQGNNNVANGDGCSSTCQTENGFTCTGTPSTCTLDPVCGNGMIESGENCDQGNNNVANGDGCSSTCQIENGFSCSGSPSTCTLDPVCGNGMIESGEACDQGNNNVANGDGCSSTCQIENGFTCTGTPSMCSPTTNPSVCGNGMIESGENCDQGNNNVANGDGCSSTCQIENGFTCTGTPSVCTIPAFCGNGIVEGNELCDDSNTDSGDGCSLCDVEPEWQCNRESPSICRFQCGNGVDDENYECDDGNSIDGDGCSILCEIESGFNCPSAGGCSLDSSSSSGSSNIGIIIGVVVGVVCCLILLIAGAIGAFFYFRNRDSDFYEENPHHNANNIDISTPHNKSTEGAVQVKPLHEIQLNMSSTSLNSTPPISQKPTPPTSQKPTPPISQKPIPPISQNTPPLFKVGSIVQAKWSDNQFYRAKILRFDVSSNRYHVNYVDFGNNEWVPASSVKN